MSDSIYFIIFFVFIYFSFEFTLIENAFLNLSSVKIKRLEENNDKNIDLIKKLNKDNNVYNATLIADYFSNSIIAISLALFMFSRFQISGLLISIFLGPVIIIIFGESVPKLLGAQKCEKIISNKVKFLYFVMVILKPFIIIIQAITNLFTKLVGGDRNYKEPLITEDELIDAVSLGIEEGIIDKNESVFIENVMDFRDSYAKDVMTPRTDIVAVNINSKHDDIVKIVKEEAFSRMPVYDEDLDDIVGILHIKDLIGLPTDFVLSDYKEILKPVFYTFEYKPIGALFNEMRYKKVSVSIVNDEYGGTEGMVTIEDLIEKIVGSISDEYDEDDDEDIIKIAPKEYLIDGSMHIDNLNHYFDLNLESNETESIAGYIIERIDRFPKKGEVITINGLNFTIKESSKNRIEKLILKL